MVRSAIARIPGSKSETARALFLAALADGTSQLTAPLVSADTVAFADGLSTLGFPVSRGADVWSITGAPSGPPAAGAEVWCHDAGTAARFLPCLAALGHGRYVVDASEQMRSRPMAPLLKALRDLGVEVASAAGDHLPITVVASGVRGGTARVDASLSSQFLSALCLMAPATQEGLRIEVEQSVVSAPYLELTLSMMKDFGATVVRDGSVIVLPAGTYQPRGYAIEPDASTASYFFAAAAVTGNTVVVPRLGAASRQGDLRFATEILPAMGCRVDADEDSITVTGPDELLSPGEVSMRDISDTMMTLAAIAPYASAPVRITDVGNCRVKESDRIDAITTALGACGITTRTGPDWLEIHPGRPRGTLVATRADHRIAMSMSITGLRAPDLRLDDPGCVAKTFPGFHDEFGGLLRAWNLDDAPAAE